MLDLKYPEGIRYLGMLYTPERLTFLVANGYTYRPSRFEATPYKMAINISDNGILTTTSRDTHPLEFMVDEQIDALMYPNRKVKALKALRSLYDTMA